MSIRSDSAARGVAVRWTIGDVSDEGFEALKLSIAGAYRVFGNDCRYAVCVNTVSLDEARERTGPVPAGVAWHASTLDQLPEFIRRHLDSGMSEGVSWKFAPVRLFPDCHEIAVDNDCILWDMPEAMRAWLQSAQPGQCLIAEDVRRCVGQFDQLCGPEAGNSGIRGLPPGLDYEAALHEILMRRPVTLRGEQDEQGLQCAATSLHAQPLLVTLADVTICSPLPIHLHHFGRCGVHFVGLNAKCLPWQSGGRSISEDIRENWASKRAAIYSKVGLNGIADAGNRALRLPSDAHGHDRHARRP